MAEYFRGIGARINDVETAISLRGTDTKLRALEIGCGDGRDAEEIIKRVDWYEGFDPSEGLLNIARDRLPNASFVNADAISYSYPENLDVVFAFASLLHVNKSDMKRVLSLATESLNTGGIIYLSLKESVEYKEEVKTDSYGQRMFYYYTPENIEELASSLEPVYEDHQIIGHTKWFTMALRK